MTIDGTEFARLALNGKPLFKGLAGVPLFHKKFGEGLILHIQERTGYMPLITVRFFSDPEEKQFNLTAFRNGDFPRVEVASDLLVRLRSCPPEPVVPEVSSANEEFFEFDFGTEGSKFEDPERPFRKAQYRVTHCWACGSNGLDSRVDRICPKCGGIICPSCGACLC